MSTRLSRSRSHESEALSTRRSTASNDENIKSPAQPSSPHSSALSSPGASRSPSQTAPDTIPTEVSGPLTDSLDALEDPDVDMEDDDNGSSSLSELNGDDASEDGSDGPDSINEANILVAAIDEEVDSEAETEHLDKTPRKPSIIQHDGLAMERSPSKLSKMLSIDQADLEAAELSSIPEEKAADSPLSDHLSGPLTNAHNLGKRKRSSSVDGPSSEVAEEERSPKRNHVVDDDLQLALLNAEDDLDQAELESEAGEPNDAEPVVGDEDNEASTVAPEAIQDNNDSEEQMAPRNRSVRRGRRKGRREILVQDDAQGETSDTPAHDNEETAEVDEEEEQAREEELAKRKLAAEALSKIERDFLAFREKHLQEQLEQIDDEISLLRESHNCVHPDYLARLVCLDERRNDKIHYENTLLRYNLQALVTRTIVERGQHLSQYHQEVREIRDTAINNCYKELFSLQKDRRRYGTEESTLMLFGTSKTEHARGQVAYNMEVSLLSGISANIGFPAAPSMQKLSDSDIHQDLVTMEVKQNNSNSVANGAAANRFPQITQQPVVNVLRAPSFQDRTTAGDQFLERTPWANPQHPAHANAPVNNFHTQGVPVGYVTPAPQRQYPISTNINGSASTIEMISNPPSSAAAPVQKHQHNPIEVPTPMSTNRKESGPITGGPDATANMQFVDGSRRNKNYALDSSPEFNRLQQSQAVYQSPSKITNATIVPIGMVTHADFGPVAPHRTAMAPVMSGGGSVGT